MPDERLDAVVETIGATPTVYETIEFHDIAGLVRGAHEGEGLGNRFLANIRETDALVHVVRAHGDAQVVHPEGRVDPLADVETIETELLYADLEQAERRLEKVAREAKSMDKAKVAEEAWLRDLVAALSEGRPARTVPPPAAAPDAMRNLQPLTSKPVLYLANVGEGERARAARRSWPSTRRPRARGPRRCRRGSRRSCPSWARRRPSTMREELGAGESGLSTVIREAWALLGLITFFTAGEGKEGRAWAIRDGHARPPGGRQHPHRHRARLRGRGDRELEGPRGVRRLREARERAKLRIEGRDYAMRDGDVMTVRFTP